MKICPMCGKEVHNIDEKVTKAAKVTPETGFISEDFAPCSIECFVVQLAMYLAAGGFNDTEISSILRNKYRISWKDCDSAYKKLQKLQDNEVFGLANVIVFSSKVENSI